MDPSTERRSRALQHEPRPGRGLLLLVGLVLAPGVGTLAVLTAIGRTPSGLGSLLLALWVAALLVLVLWLEWRRRAPPS